MLCFALCVEGVGLCDDVSMKHHDAEHDGRTEIRTRFAWPAAVLEEQADRVIPGSVRIQIDLPHAAEQGKDRSAIRSQLVMTIAVDLIMRKGTESLDCTIPSWHRGVIRFQDGSRDT